MKFLTFLLLQGMILLSACAPSAQTIQTGIATTQAANPPMTLAPFQTATENPSPIATGSQTPTLNDTPLPGTQTVEAEAIIDSAIIANATATQLANVVAINGTEQAHWDYATKIAAYKPMSGLKIDTTYQLHSAEKVKVTGMIVMFFDAQHFTITTIDNHNLAIQLLIPATDLSAGNWVTIYGQIGGKSGSFSGITGINDTLLIDAFYEKK